MTQLKFRTVQELENARENTSYSNIATSAQTTVKSEAGFLAGVMVNASPTSAIRFYDNTVSGGTTIATIPASVGAGTFYQYGLRFENGLVVSSGSSDTNLTIMYR